MKTKKGEKEKLRKVILEAGGRVLRRKGVSASGVDEVLGEAGLTSGALYSHFSSKQALNEELILCEVERTKNFLKGNIDARPGSALEKWIAVYLSLPHVQHCVEGCGLAALSSDIARTEASFKARFEAKLQELFLLMTELAPQPLTVAQASMIFSMMVGALIVARMMKDRTLITNLLSQTQEAIRVIVTCT